MSAMQLWNRTSPPSRRSSRSALKRRANRQNFPQCPIEVLEDRTLLAQVVVLNHQAHFPGAFNFWASSTDSTTSTGAVVYDSFAFNENTQFDRIAWQGVYQDADVASNPPAPNTATWRVNIWDDNGFGTGPGSDLLVSRNVAAASVTSEFVANADIGGGVFVPVFNFQTDLVSKFQATANAVYWLSVISIAGGANDPAWGWTSGIGPGDGSIQQNLGSPVNIPRDGDRAFRLTNVTDDVPGNGPPAPTLTAPTGTIDDLTPTFTWSAVAGAARYDLWVNVFGSNDLVFRDQNIAGTSFTLSAALQNEETYIWTVRGIAADGAGGDWADHEIFTTQLAADLAAPTNLQPSGTSGLTPTFSWSAVSGAAHYDVWVNVRGSNELVFRNTNVNGTSVLSPVTLDAGQQYIWTVRAVTAGNAGGVWANHATFTAIPQGVPPAGAPTPLAPTGTTGDSTPAFQWTSVSGADHYDVWLNVRGSNELVFRNQNVVGTTFTPSTPLEAQQSYIWTVRAISADGTPSDWAPHAIFDVDFPPAPPGSVPTLLEPIGTATTSTPTFRWTSVPGATRYDLWVNVFGSNDLVFRDQNVATASLVSPVALTDDARYIWTVRAFVGNTVGDWTDHATFVVDLQVAGLEPTLDRAVEATDFDEVDEALADWEATQWWAEEEQLA